MKGRRSALSQVLFLKRLNLDNSREFSILMRNFEHFGLPREIKPECKVTLILPSITKPLYEPLQEASDKHLRLEAVFPFALASAKRLIDTLSYSINYYKG